MTAKDQQQEQAEPSAAPLFSLDLGANGGILEPTSIDELKTWITKEVGFWISLRRAQAGNLKAPLEHAIQPLDQALAKANEAEQLATRPDDGPMKAALKNAHDHLHDAYINRGLIHSNTPVARKIVTFEPARALSYLYAFLAPGNQRFEALNKGSWRGFLEGMADCYGVGCLDGASLEAEREALQSLWERAETLLGEKRRVADELHREFTSTAEAIKVTRSAQQEAFNELLESAQSGHQELLDTHGKEMESLHAAFRESMALRGPVEYWKSRAATHTKKASGLMRWMFGSMAVLGAALISAAAWVFATIHEDGKPDAWKVAVLVLLGVLGVWAIRLIVRMYLSNAHLATDADERVTMVMTYLALLEGGNMPSDEDRTLVLAPLFRPASDGIVKDASFEF
jgi:hypothetical protein